MAKKIASEEYQEKAKLLNADEAERLLSRMSGVKRWLKSTVSQRNNLLIANSKQSLSFGVT